MNLLPSSMMYIISIFLVFLGITIYIQTNRIENLTDYIETLTNRVDNLNHTFNNRIIRNENKIEILIQDVDGWKSKSRFYLGQVYNMTARILWCQEGYSGDQIEYLRGILEQIGIDLAEMRETGTGELTKFIYWVKNIFRE